MPATVRPSFCVVATLVASLFTRRYRRGWLDVFHHLVRRVLAVLLAEKYCNNCLTKFYAESLDSLPHAYVCPSCRYICVCAACVRRPPLEGPEAVTGASDSSAVSPSIVAPAYVPAQPSPSVSYRLPPPSRDAPPLTCVRFVLGNQSRTPTTHAAVTMSAESPAVPLAVGLVEGSSAVSPPLSISLSPAYYVDMSNTDVTSPPVVHVPCHESYVQTELLRLATAHPSFGDCLAHFISRYHL